MDTTRHQFGAGWLALLRPARDPGAADRPPLAAVIARIRGRWRLRLLLEGLFWTLLLSAAAFVAAAWLVNEWHFSPAAVWTLRGALLLTLLALAAWFCLRPLRRRVDDLQVALYLEEHEPGLRSIVLSAVDARRGEVADVSAQLVDQLEARALEACAARNFGDEAERVRQRNALLRLGLAGLALAMLALAPPAFLRTGAPALLQAWESASEVSPYRIDLAPGDIEIARGADQLIAATIEGYDGDGVQLFTSGDRGETWQVADMPSTRPGVFETFLFDVAADTDYYVSGAGRDTAVYRLSVIEIPAVESIGLRYHFPDYTMLPPRTVEDSGDIAALVGTRVEVVVEPTIGIPGGALEFAGGERIELRRGEDGRWVGEFVVRQDDSYRVILQRASGIEVETVSEYSIVALTDQIPSVSILSPGRDSKVSMIEEAVLRVEANDDQGIASLELVMSINGEAEQRIPLLPDEPGAARNVEAEHIVYLEDLGLQPGDLISYYVHAEERAPDDSRRTATSDIFFYQVRPFSNNFRRAEQQAGGGGGGGGGSGEQQGQLAEQQRQFVVATFKMIRDRERFTEQTWNENLDLLVTAQSRIRDRVEAIVRRIESRPMVRNDERYKVILEELPSATEAMRKVEAQLGEAEVEGALTDAQVALKHLQRADAQFRDINVALSNQQGSGSGNNQNFEDLFDLFQLEMDKLRHQYDTVQHGSQQPQPEPEAAIDETLEKLRELARRQQQEVERMLRRQGQAGNGGAEDRQLALAEELEEMARQLERLTREQPNRQLRQSIRQMRDAAEAMRQAAEASASGGGGADQAREAAERLREARRLLDRGKVQQFSEAVERSLRRAELAERKQAEIRRDVEGMDTDRDAGFDARLERLEQKKRSLTRELTELENELGELLPEAREEQPEAGQSLRRAIRAAREDRLQERIGRTRQMLRHDNRELADDNEGEIQRGIARMREHIEEALASVDDNGPDGTERALEDLRELARDMRALRERAAAGGERNRQGGNDNGEARPGERSASRDPNRGDGAAIGSTRIDADGRGRGLVTPTELTEVVRRGRAVGEQLLEEDIPPGDINPLLESLEALTQGDTSAQLEAQELALQALMELEFKLRNQLENPDQPALLVSEPADIPDEYRDQVADYFRNLSNP